MEAVRLENVSFQYTGVNRKNGIKNISMSVKEGECVLLTGISGCGKSTILRVINGLAPYFYEGEITGKIELMGKQTDEIPFAEISKICGSVFQNPRSQFFYMNTSSEIAFGCENQGIPTEEIEARVADCVEQFQLEDLQNRNIMQLSGGEKQKIAFASIYAGRPDIYVLDEPSANLDFDAIKDIERILKTLKKQGKTIIIAEHRLYYLMELADRVCYIKDGEIAQEYTIEAFKKLSGQELREKGLRSLDYRILHEEELGQEKIDRDISEKSKRESWNAAQHIYMKEVACRYKGREEPVLKIKECRLPLHEKIAVIGHNGAGKSTFMDGLCGMNKSVKGIYCKENDILPIKRRAKESFEVFQEINHQLFTNSVEEEISLGSENKNVEERNGLMSMLDLTNYADTHPMALSGGQKQRVAIASALYSDRKLICLDEPTSGLDYHQMERVAKLLEQVQPKLDLLLIITHDLEFILKTCTYIVHIENGEVLEQYSLDEEGKEKLFRFFNYEK